MFFIILAFIIAALVLAVLLFKIRIDINVEQKDITVNIKFFGLIKFTKKLLIKFEDKAIVSLYMVKKKGLKKLTTLRKLIIKILEKAPDDRTLVNLISFFLKYVNKGQKEVVYSHIYKRVKYDLKINLQIGISDAFITAISCGFLWALSNALCAIFNNRVHKTSVSLYPEFSEQVISVRINCIIRFSPADIIIGYSVSKIIEAVKKNASN